MATHGKHLTHAISHRILSEMVKTYRTTSEAYQQLLKDLLYNFEYESAPRGLRIREILDYSFGVLEPTADPIVTADPERNIKLASYLEKEKALYNSMTNSAAEFGIAASLWKKIQNPDGTINSAYGKLIWSDKICGNEAYEPSEPFRTPWEWAKHSLIKDPDTRQAIMHFNRPEHCWNSNKDLVCTLNAQFFIRRNQLHLSVRMRSNDCHRGTPYDVPWFCGLIHQMVDELRPTYPELLVGHYHHHAGSMHIYESNWSDACKMLY
jgi:hypothetical protein